MSTLDLNHILYTLYLLHQKYLIAKENQQRIMIPLKTIYDSYNKNSYIVPNITAKENKARAKIEGFYLFIWH